MTFQLNETHDQKLTSWVESANDGTTDFPIQNLPLGVFKTKSAGEPRIGVAIGNQILDLAQCAKSGLLNSLSKELRAACEQTSLNALMSLGTAAWSALRLCLSRLLRAGSTDQKATARCLIPQSEAEMVLPATIGNYTDFYASIHHATNVGKMLRPDAPLMPNYKHVPIGYHGRASSIVVSGTSVRRPLGQLKADDASAPAFGPSRTMDYELELGMFIGAGNKLGEPIPIAKAAEQLFGVCLLNDWSARDVQKWEYQPLGPFLAKNFCSTLSPWVVTAEALAPFRVPPSPRPAGDPTPLPYLLDAGDQQSGGIGITVEVWLTTAKMRAAGQAPVRLSHGQFAGLYWTPAQFIAHHSSNGCNLCPGDLLGSGTVSGPEKENRGCLLELTWRGAEPLSLPNGETRKFLEDGDEVILRGHCEAPDRPRIGLGECRGILTPSIVG
jgi:fumarylacetoacetase